MSEYVVDHLWDLEYIFLLTLMSVAGECGCIYAVVHRFSSLDNVLVHACLLVALEGIDGEPYMMAMLYPLHQNLICGY